jgi:hypothetical protein
MQSKVCSDRGSRIKVGFIEFFLSKTPAVEPLAATHRFRPELNPVNVLEDQSGNGTDEPDGGKVNRRGERSCCAPGAAASFSRALRNSLIPAVLQGLALSEYSI